MAGSPIDYNYFLRKVPCVFSSPNAECRPRSFWNLDVFICFISFSAMLKKVRGRTMPSFSLFKGLFWPRLWTWFVLFGEFEVSGPGHLHSSMISFWLTCKWKSRRAPSAEVKGDTVPRWWFTPYINIAVPFPQPALFFYSVQFTRSRFYRWCL